MSQFNEVPSDYVPGTGKLFVRINTNKGTMVIELFENRAPKTVANFVGLATGKRTWTDPETNAERNDPFYDGVIFHRVIPGFMIQTGDRTGTGRGGPGYRFEDEFHPELVHDKVGVLSMANAGPNTNGGQFFITEGPTPHLNNRHAVFGQVTEGLDIVNVIASAPRNGSDRPHDEIRMESVEIFRAD